MELLKRKCIASVVRYRESSRRQAHRGSCRFTPSCSTFALEALETRPLPIALASIAWRIVRCNPFVRIGTHDPVHRAKLLRRPNSARTAFATLFLGGLLVLFTSGLALGQGVGGGCSGTANGRSPAAMTFGDPLVVGEGENVQIRGQAPGGRARGKTYLSYSIALVDGISNIDTRTELHGEGANWRGTVNVSDYLRYGSGKYRVEGTVTTTEGSYTCPVSFYVFLDGNKIIGIVGAGMAGAGGLGVLRAARAPGPGEKEAPMFEPDSDPDEEVEQREQIKEQLKPHNLANLTADSGCLIIAIIDALIIKASPTGYSGPTLEDYNRPVAPIENLILALPGAASITIWRKGRTGLGFFCGLLFGLGATVAGQQFGYWTLNPVSLFAVPVFSAIAGSVRARRGKAFKAEEVPPPPPDI